MDHPYLVAEPQTLPDHCAVPAFVIFLLASDVICFIALKFFPGTFVYRYFYCWSQLGESALRTLVAIQILGGKLVVYRVKILLWSMYFAFGLITIFAFGLPAGMLQIIIISDLLAAIVLAIAVCWPYIGWHDTQGYSALAFGLLFSMCSDVALYLVRFKTGLIYLPYVRAALPLAGMMTLVLFVIAAIVSTKPNARVSGKSITA